MQLFKEEKSCIIVIVLAKKLDKRQGLFLSQTNMIHIDNTCP